MIFSCNLPFLTLTRKDIYAIFLDFYSISCPEVPKHLMVPIFSCDLSFVVDFTAHLKFLMADVGILI